MTLTRKVRLHCSCSSKALNLLYFWTQYLYSTENYNVPRDYSVIKLNKKMEVIAFTVTKLEEKQMSHRMQFKASSVQVQLLFLLNLN